MPGRRNFQVCLRQVAADSGLDSRRQAIFRRATGHSKVQSGNEHENYTDDFQENYPWHLPSPLSHAGVRSFRKSQPFLINMASTAIKLAPMSAKTAIHIVPLPVSVGIWNKEDALLRRRPAQRDVTRPRPGSSRSMPIILPRLAAFRPVPRSRSLNSKHGPPDC
jgi:hypothetical protein